MRYSLILVVALMVLSLAVRYFADPVRLAQASPDPAHDLHELCQHDPVLGHALEQADRGDVTELVKWINRADLPERQRLAALLFGLVRRPGSGEGDPFDNALCRRYCNRFRAFLDLDTGNEALDTEIDNLVAYTLVANGDRPPTAQELAIARALLPRLRRAAMDGSDAAIMDTVGCVQFTCEEFAAAKESFALAQRYAGETRDKQRSDKGDLYSRRLAAAEANAKLKSEGRPAEYAPLPPEEEPAAPTAPTAPAEAKEAKTS